MKEVYFFTNSEEGVDIVGSGLIYLLSCLFCQFWEIPGLLFPLIVV